MSRYAQYSDVSTAAPTPARQVRLRIEGAEGSGETVACIMKLQKRRGILLHERRRSHPRRSPQLQGGLTLCLWRRRLWSPLPVLRGRVRVGAEHQEALLAET